MDEDTVIRLRRVVLRLARQLNATSVGEGLTPTQASVLGSIANRGPLGLAELTEIEGLNPTMLSRVVGKLDSFGLIRRLRDPDDFRAARVEVTSEGRQAYQRIAAQRAAIISECVAGLPAEQETALVAALPALENLAEGLRAAVQRGRAQQVREDQDEQRRLRGAGRAHGVRPREFGPPGVGGERSQGVRVDDEDVAPGVPPQFPARAVVHQGGQPAVGRGADHDRAGPDAGGVLGDHPPGHAMAGRVPQHLARGRDAVRGQ